MRAIAVPAVGERKRRRARKTQTIFSGALCSRLRRSLDGGGRTADAIADTASTIYRLPAAALAMLDRDEPAIAARVYRNLAKHLSGRLRGAAAAWRLAAA